MAEPGKYLVGESLRQRMRTTIEKVEGMPTGSPVGRIPTFLEGDFGGVATPTLRLGTISATWSKGSNATVTQQNGDGTAISPSQTFTASNYFATITVSSGTKRVACGLVGSTWLLIAAEC